MKHPFDLGEPQDAQEKVFVLAMRLSVAAAFGVVVAVTRTYSRRDSKPSPGFRTTLVLLTVLTALVTEVIGNNLARAFGLAGALAVVRFRTVVEDTRDSAFVIFAMATGMAVGAGYFWTAAIGTPIVAAVAILARFVGSTGPFAGPSCDGLVEVRFKANSPAEKELPAVLEPFASRVQLQSLFTTKEADGMEAAYRIRPHPDTDIAALVRAVKGLAGVEKVGYSPVTK